MRRYLFFDTETTGIPPDHRAPYTDTRNWPRLVEIAWVVCGEDGAQQTTAELLIRPEGFTIPVSAARVHGITTERAREDGVFPTHVGMDRKP